MDEPRNPWGSPGGVVALPPLPPGPTRRRRTSALPIVGLVVLAIAAGVLAYVFSSHHKTKTTNASAVKTTTTLRSPFGAATPASPFAAPGFTAPSTFPTTFSTLPPGIVPGAPGAPAAAAPVDTSKFLVSPSGAVCENGGMTVNGTIRNNGATRATVNFTVRVVDASGATLGAAQATAPALAPGEQRSFAATGQCTGTLGGGDRAIPVVDSATAA
jgi:hypothetical protein